MSHTATHQWRCKRCAAFHRSGIGRHHANARTSLRADRHPTATTYQQYLQSPPPLPLPLPPRVNSSAGKKTYSQARCTGGRDRRRQRRRRCGRSAESGRSGRGGVRSGRRRREGTKDIRLRGDTTKRQRLNGTDRKRTQERSIGRACRPLHRRKRRSDQIPARQ